MPLRARRALRSISARSRSTAGRRTGSVGIASHLPPVFGGGGQFEAELADLSAEFADLAAQPLDVGAGGQVDRMQNPRRHAVEGGGDGGAGLGEDRAEFGVAARADERFSRGARRFSIASYAS